MDVKAKESDTSLQLSLEVKEVRAALGRYVDKLEKITKDKNDVIGYVFAINGKVVSADIYGSSAMFSKLWPRLLKATATEAFAEMQKDKKFDPVALAAVHTFFAEADKGNAPCQPSGADGNSGLHHVPAEGEIFEPSPVSQTMRTVSFDRGGAFRSFFHKAYKIRILPLYKRRPLILTRWELGGSP